MALLFPIHDDLVQLWLETEFPFRVASLDTTALPPVAMCMTMSYKTGKESMAGDQLVQARVDAAVKEEASVVLASMGLTVSDAVRLLLVKVAAEKALPFAPLVPNEATSEAMREARKGDLPRFGSVQALLDDLHAGD